ncbi:MAG: cytochrome c maturation protein CcmE [Pseudomonadota bacterium]|nr:cytochrome c maturation protein CcmE [Pseudomonadota bacterium]
MSDSAAPSPLGAAPARAWTPRRRRLAALAAVLLTASVSVALVLRAFSDNLVFFLTPTQVAEGQAQGRSSVRVGGMVQAGSIQREAGSLQVRFVLTDYAHSVPVTYEGVLPDLFVEGKGAVAQGQLNAQGHLTASEVLAKHDENYTAPGMEGHPAKMTALPANEK